MPTARKNTVVKPPAAEPWVSLPKAADMLGRSRLKVLQLALKGVLVAEQRGEWTYISRESIDRALASGI